jgi:hypothetical protein
VEKEMRALKAYTLDDWPRRKNAELIFTTTNEAIYFANLTDDRVGSYNLLKKWRKNAYQDIEHARQWSPINYNRIFDLAVRAQLYRECMEEIQRLNDGKFELPGGK